MKTLSLWATFFIYSCAEQLLTHAKHPWSPDIVSFERPNQADFHEIWLTRNWAENNSSVYIHHTEPAIHNIFLNLRALKQNNCCSSYGVQRNRYANSKLAHARH